jgi:hypothetical protein
MTISTSVFGRIEVTGIDAEIFDKQISHGAVPIEAINAAKNGKELAQEYSKVGVVAIVPLSYDAWLKAKVEKSIAEADDPTTPRFTTKEVMERMAQIIETTALKKSSSSANIHNRI